MAVASRAVVGAAGADAAEERLVARIVAGDATALDRVYDRHAPYVFALALRVCRDRAIAEDVTQEVFVHLWERADAYDPLRASVRTWLGLLAHRRSVDRIRREESRRQREERDHLRGGGVEPAVDDEVMRSLASNRVRAALYVALTSGEYQIIR